MSNYFHIQVCSYYCSYYASSSVYSTAFYCKISVEFLAIGMYERAEDGRYLLASWTEKTTVSVLHCPYKCFAC